MRISTSRSIFRCRASSSWPTAKSVVLMGDPYLTEQVAGRDYRISAGSFFQVNTAGAEALVDLVRGLPGANGRRNPGRSVLRSGAVWAGPGRPCRRVIGVEPDRSAAADFRHNARGLAHVELIEGCDRGRRCRASWSRSATAGGAGSAAGRRRRSR